ncbi:LysR family transcriptional regulator [Enterovirga sp.]|uniref:LysR family transcriptional regulator n=1 Tax=Enterovirga sp. TaxID=2026350 RepID=UPI002C9DF885|nr:LysR family transcriptional regulator [Enterovirga sp.]HMO28107.1 LysR family transcriptional regulator [Enterovirga sp.]
MSLEIRHLRYFLAVTDRGSVADAARHLHIAQPALSRQIMDLESDVGAALFMRSGRGMKLTAAGAQFAMDCRRLLADLHAARERAARISAGQLGALRIGVAPNYGWHPVVLKTLHAFRKAVPAISVILEPHLAMRQIEKIADGSLDGGYLTWRPRNDPTFAAIRLFTCRLKLAFHRDSAFARQVPDRLAMLRDEPCIWFAREIAPDYNDFLIHQCREAGLTPKMAQVGSDISTILGLVAAGMGYSIVSDAAVHFCPADVVLVDHPELSRSYPVEFVWRADADNPCLDRFVSKMLADPAFSIARRPPEPDTAG